MRYAVLCVALLISAPCVSGAQDLTVSLVRLYVARQSHEPTTHLEVQAAKRIASVTRERHPLRLAFYWGSWRAPLQQPSTATDPPPMRWAHQVGLRLMHTPTSKRFQPFLVVGYASEFGTEWINRRYNIHMIETSIALSYAIYPNLRVHTTASLYHQFVSEDYAGPLHSTLKAGLTFGRL